MHTEVALVLTLYDETKGSSLSESVYAAVRLRLTIQNYRRAIRIRKMLSKYNRRTNRKGMGQAF